MTVATASLVAGVLIVGSMFAVRSLDRSGGVMPAPAPPSPVPRDWMVEHGLGSSSVITTKAWEDPRDTSVAGIDMTQLEHSNGHWYLELADVPPMDRTTAEVFSYGLVLDTTEDGVPDYLVGLEDDPAAPPSDFDPHPSRVWVTDLATGKTDEQIGPPYGYPVEFGHPDEDDIQTVWFTFLGGSAPPAMDGRSVRFYAWASLTINGQVVARDVAPDEGWMKLGPPRP